MTPLEDPGLRIMVATRPVDFRRGHDGLAAYAQMALGFAPQQGLVLVFRARRSDRLKILYWDSNGIVMSYKRLEAGNFVWPKPGDAVMGLTKLQFEALFSGLDWRRIAAPTACLPQAVEWPWRDFLLSFIRRLLYEWPCLQTAPHHQSRSPIWASCRPLCGRQFSTCRRRLRS